jgi:hypothetical protein
MEDRRSLPPYEDEFSLALLRSAQQDEPSAAAYSKVATALGVSAAVGIGASVPAQAMLASNGLSASALARWSGSLFGKVVLVGVSGVLLVAGGVALRHHTSSEAREARAKGASALHGDVSVNALSVPRVFSTPPSAPAQLTALAQAESAPTPPATSARLVEESNVRSAASPAPVAPAAAVVAPKASRSASSARAARASSLPEQVLSLDRARVALSSGDPGAALMEIAHYRSAWPRGVFLTEASVLEIEALAKRGEIVLAGMRAQAFVTAHPDSPQADRLRALIPREAR